MTVRTARAYMHQLHPDGYPHPLPGEHRKRWTLSAEACALGARMAASVAALAPTILSQVGERSGPGVTTPTPSGERGPGRPREYLVNMDETGWRLRGQRRFLWGAFSQRHAVLRIMGDRDGDRVWELLGSSTAAVTSDRWWAYRVVGATNDQPNKRC